MSGVAFSRARLDHMHDVMAGHVERGEIDFWNSAYQAIDD